MEARIGPPATPVTAAPESSTLVAGSQGEVKAEPSPVPGKVPRHVAIIMDGNGRWAEQQGLPRLDGHRRGVDAILRVVELLAQRGVKFLTIYAFSTENWARPSDEVEGIIGLLHQALERETEQLRSKNIRVVHIGNLSRLVPDIRRAVKRVQDETAGNTGIVFNVAFDYGGRQEILEAARKLVREGIAPEEITEEAFSRRLSTAHCPDPDLIIRTGGELRISNFLLWQSAYSEYYHTPVLWPDIDEAEIDQALDSYAGRQRRFGNVSPDAGG